jgi:hypothetical protein
VTGTGALKESISAKESKPQVELPAVQEQAPTPRKRPGAGARTILKPHGTKEAPKGIDGPSDEVIAQFEKFSNDVENEVMKETKASRLSPSKIKPKAPKHRFKDRNPKDPSAMDVDSEDYVYDTYVREVIMPDADGKILAPEATVGLIVLTVEDEEWWFEEDESDREFDTDDEDSNAEEYYANDYPEDEVDSDDEFERDPYRYHHGDEEYDLDDAGSDEENEQPLRQTIPKLQAGYWGQQGE